MTWKKLKSETVFDSKWVKLHKDKVELPNGQRIDDFYSVSLLEASAIVAITLEQNIILKNEYRYTFDEELIEVPAGGFEPSETDGLSAAKRELKEETGYVSDEWMYLGATVESSAKLTNQMHIYFANNCIKVDEPQLDATEMLDVMVIPLKEAVDMVMRNEIRCNSSAHGILRVARMLGI